MWCTTAAAAAAGAWPTTSSVRARSGDNAETKAPVVCSRAMAYHCSHSHGVCVCVCTYVPVCYVCVWMCVCVDVCVCVLNRRRGDRHREEVQDE